MTVVGNGYDLTNYACVHCCACVKLYCSHSVVLMLVLMPSDDVNGNGSGLGLTGMGLNSMV
jgi:hypothetical protein